MQKNFIQIFSVALDMYNYSHNDQLQEEIDAWLAQNPTAQIQGTNVSTQNNTVVVAVHGIILIPD
jgi:Fe-S cluster biosynthesis and repair protein YggX